MTGVPCCLFVSFTVCRARIDLGFLIDGSSGTGRTNFKRILQYIKETVRRFEVSITKTRVGVVVYSSRAKVVLNFKSTPHISSVYRAVERIRFVGGLRNTGRALSYAKRFLFRGKPRCGRRRVIVMITTGRSSDQVRRPATSLQEVGTEIYVIGIGAVSRANLMYIATDRSHLLLVTSKSLFTITRTIKDRICHQRGQCFSVSKSFKYFIFFALQYT